MGFIYLWWNQLYFFRKITCMWIHTILPTSHIRTGYSDYLVNSKPYTYHDTIFVCIMYVAILYLYDSPSVILFKFFSIVAGHFPAISDDLVNSYHLLLCCIDWVYANSILGGRKDLLNSDFQGDYNSCILLCFSLIA